MKNFLIYIVGFVSGIIFLSFVAKCSSNKAEESNTLQGLTLFEQPADVMDITAFEVNDVISGGNAIARAGEHTYRNEYMYTGIEVLFLADENKSYYDGKVIYVSSDKCVRQIGVYKHSYKTVPVVAICDK